MKVRITEDILIAGEHTPKGTVVDVDQQTAGNLFSAGRAEHVTDEPAPPAPVEPPAPPPAEELPPPAEDPPPPAETPAGKPKKEK